MYSRSIAVMTPRKMAVEKTSRTKHAGIQRHLKKPLGHALEAFHCEDYEALCRAYAQIGVLLGIRQQCTEVIFKNARDPTTTVVERDLAESGYFEKDDERRAYGKNGLDEDEKSRMRVRDAACKAVENKDVEALGLKVEINKRKIIDNQTANPDLEKQRSAVIVSKDAKPKPCEFVEWKRPIPVTITDSRKPGGGVMRLKDETKRSAPYKTHRTSNGVSQQRGRAYNYKYTRLIINDLSTRIGVTEIQDLFRDFKSVKCYSVKYDDSGKSIGVATVAFSDRNAAIKALNYFANPRQGGFVLNVRLAA